MSELVTLIKCLPALLALVRSIEKALEDAKDEREVKDVVNKVTVAFNAKDASQLNSIFNK